METRDLWENQVERVTEQTRLLIEKVDYLEERLDYVERVLATLLFALKSSGHIVDDPDGDHTMPS